MDSPPSDQHTLDTEDVKPLIQKIVGYHLCEVDGCPECAERDEHGRLLSRELWESA